MKKFIKVTIFLAILQLANAAHAQILIEQGKIRLSVKPEQRIVDKIIVHNTSNKEIDVRIYWEDFLYIAPYNGEKKFLPAGSNENTCSEWISFLPKEMIIKPFETRQVNYTISVPKNARGGYYGVLFFEDQEDNIDSKLGLKIVARVGSLFFIETEGKTKKAQINGIKIQGNRIEGSITNSGDVIIVAKGVYYILDESGLAVDRGEVTPMYIPLGGEASFSFDILDGKPSQKYSAILTFDLEDGDSLVTEMDIIKQKSGNISIERIVE